MACDYAVEDYSCSKYQDAETERLYALTLDGLHDAEAGDTAYGSWYGLLNAERAIVRQDSQGFVYSHRYASVRALRAAWQAIEADDT